MKSSANLKTADWASGAVSPLTSSPERITRSGFSLSRTRPMKSRVRGSASHLPPLRVEGSASRQMPRPVERWRSET